MSISSHSNSSIEESRITTSTCQLSDPRMRNSDHSQHASNKAQLPLQRLLAVDRNHDPTGSPPSQPTLKHLTCPYRCVSHPNAQHAAQTGEKIDRSVRLRRDPRRDGAAQKEGKVSEDEWACVSTVDKHTHRSVEGGEGRYGCDSEDLEQQEHEKGEGEGDPANEARSQERLHEGHVGGQSREEESHCDEVEELALNDLRLTRQEPSRQAPAHRSEDREPVEGG